MKYLIFGVQGMAGHMIAEYLLEQGHTVVGFARTKSAVCPAFCADAQDEKAVEQALGSDEFDYVINAVGVLNQRVDADPAAGIYLNSVFPHLLAKKLKGQRTKLIHISTDCVFEGTRGAYQEGDVPDAVSLYGRSKALGEVRDGKNLTLRTSIVGPELKADGTGLFHWFMSQAQPVYGYTNVIWSGVTTLELAKAVEAYAENPRTGLVHLVNNRTVSKYDLLCLFNRYCRQAPSVIIKQDRPVCDKSLICKGVPEPLVAVSYEEMVREMAEWIQAHPSLYTQYLK